MTAGESPARSHNHIGDALNQRIGCRRFSTEAWQIGPLPNVAVPANYHGIGSPARDIGIWKEMIPLDRRTGMTADRLTGLLRRRQRLPAGGACPLGAPK
jgi:hypothetical protein